MDVWALFIRISYDIQHMGDHGGQLCFWDGSGRACEGSVKGRLCVVWESGGVARSAARQSSPALECQGAWEEWGVASGARGFIW